MSRVGWILIGPLLLGCAGKPAKPLIVYETVIEPGPEVTRYVPLPDELCRTERVPTGSVRQLPLVAAQRRAALEKVNCRLAQACGISGKPTEETSYDDCH